MHSIRTFFLLSGLSLILSGISFAQETVGEIVGERVLSLQSIQEVKRDGRVEIEHTFAVEVQGKAIQRGPCLNFVTAFRGPGGLILKNRIEVLELFRNGEPEPFRESIGEGTHKVFCGEKSVLLEPGVHEYTFRCTTDGEWVFKNGEAIGSFDVSGPFAGFPVDSARLILRFPDGIRLSRYSPVVHRALGERPFYEAKQSGNELIVSTTGPLEKDHAFLVNVVWPAEGFATHSQWIEVLKQHPRLPLSAFSAVILLWALGILVVRFRRNHRRILVAPAG